MKKLLAILLLVSLTLLTVGTMAMAEDTGAPATDPPTADAPAVTTNSDAAPTGSSGVNLYLDFSRYNETDFNGIYSFPITIGLDYSEDFIVGAYYSAGTNYGHYNGTVPTGYSLNSYLAYFGYNIISQDDLSLGIIASYLNVNPKQDSANKEFTSIGVGFKGEVKLAPGFKMSLLYSYGFNNTYNNGTTKYTDKIYTSLINLKAIYYFSDTVGVHAVFRWNPSTSEYYPVWRYNLGSAGVGIDFKF